MAADFASVVLAGSGAALSWWVLVCGELASDDELGEIRGCSEGQKWGFRKDLLGFSCLIPPMGCSVGCGR